VVILSKATIIGYLVTWFQTTNLYILYIDTALRIYIYFISNSERDLDSQFLQSRYMFALFIAIMLEYGFGIVALLVIQLIGYKTLSH
jgi:hypothetical protein